MTADAKSRVPENLRLAAAHYLGRGFIPIPIPRQGRCKAPTLTGWQDLRPAPEDLDGLFPDTPCNVGLLTGAPSNGLLDVDLDTCEAVTAGSLLLPRTGWIFGRQGKPRSHWLYQVEDPPDKAQDPYRDLDGRMLVEVHSTRWQVVVPPSVHETGQAVCWHTCTEPARVDLATLQAAARATAACALLGRHWPEPGSRQDGFLALAGGLLRGGWTPPRVEQFVHALAAVTRDEEARKRVQTVVQTAHKLGQQQAVTGWPRLAELIGGGEEVVRRVRRWLGLLAPHAAAAQVRVLPPYRPFPVGALPAPIAAYVAQGAKALGCDPAYLALPALAVAASVIGNTRCLRLKRGWEEPCVVWSAIVGDSGTLKSPAYLKAVAYLFRLQKRLLAEFKAQAAQYQEDLAEYKAAKRKAQDEGTDPGPPPEEPLLQRVVCSDTTIEKLAEILEDNPRGTLLARDELAGWLGSFTRYKGKQGGTDLPNWLEMHRAGTVVVDRKTGERRTLFIPRAAVCIAGGIQPGVLARALTPEFLDAGLAARLLMAMPPKLPKRWSEAEVDPEVEQAYQKVLDQLLALGFDTSGGEKVPHVLHLSAEAKAAWVAFYDAWAQEQAAAEGEVAAALSKLEGYAARLALLHHVVTCVGLDVDDRREVGTRSVQAGVELCRWFAGETRRLYATLSESAEERETRRLLEFVQGRGGRITVRELMRGNCRRYPDAATAEAALGRLVEGGWARWVEVPTAMKGGKPIQGVELCMTHDSDDTDAGDDDGDCPATDDTAPDTGPGGAGGGMVVGQPGTEVSEGPTSTNGEVTRLRRDGGVIAVMRHAPGSGTCLDGEGNAEGSVADGVSDHLVMQARGGTFSPHYLVKDRDGLGAVLAALDDSDVVGLDLETTGLDPRQDRVRLLALDCDTNDGGRFTYLIDCFVVDPTPLWEVLAGKELVIHNAAFDLAFLARLGFTPAAQVHDTLLLSQLLTAGTGERVTLAACSQRDLGLTLDKTEQKSDWATDLTAEQLAYAAHDAAVLAPLLQALTTAIRGAGLAGVVDLEGRALPALVWMARQGVAFDRQRWLALAGAASAQADRLRRDLDQAAPPRPDGALFAQPWNWDSPAQVQEVLALAGCPVADTADDTLAAVAHPLAQLLRRYRGAAKKVSVYGQGWLKHVAPDGRVYPSWKQLGAITGRMSCSGPNMQQLPRGEVRRCVVAPAGRALVKADWSQLHLRIIAGVAPEPAMQAAFRDGLDLHTLTARRLTGKEDVTKEERQRAKAAAFGLCYGMGAERFRAYARADYGLDLSAAEAASLRRGFFRAYPGLRSWHRRQAEGEVTVKAPSGRACRKVKKFSDKLAYAILLVEADCLKTALALLWERRGQAPGAFPVLACHDELVEEWLVGIMLEAATPFLAPVPVEVCASIGTTWGGGEIRPEKSYRSKG